MKVTAVKEERSATLAIEGKIDTTTSPDFEAEIAKVIDDVDLLVLDFKEVIYLSSAGLRALLNAHKKIIAHGKMVIKNVNDVVMDVFDMTGFSSILNIEA